MAKEAKTEETKVDKVEKAEKEKKAKEAKIQFYHVSNPYFFFTSGKIRCQFVKSVYETSDKTEIAVLRDYMYNTSDLIEK